MLALGLDGGVAGPARSSAGEGQEPADADAQEEVAEGAAHLDHVLPRKARERRPSLGGSIRIGTSTKLLPAHSSLIRISAW